MGLRPASRCIRLQPRRIDDTDPFRLLHRTFAVGLTYPLKERRRLAFEAIRRLGTARGACQAGGHGQVEQQGQVGSQVTLNQTLELGDASRVQSPAAALVGVGRVGETITQDPLPAREGRADDPRQVVGTRGEHQQQFAVVAHAVGVVAEQQFADPFGERCPAGLAGYDDPSAGGLEMRADELEAGRLPGALAAFQGDEASPRHPRRPLSW